MMATQGTLTGIPEPPPVVTKKKPEKPKPARNVSDGTLILHAKECRNRFLKKTLPALVKANRNLTKKLIIFHLALSVKTPIKALESFSGVTSKDEHLHWDEPGKYNLIKKLPDDRLNDILMEVLLKGIEETSPEVLLEMTEEAGISMLKDFGPDQKWLETLTKDDLISYAGACNITLGKLAKTGKKKEIVEAVAKADLRGKLPRVLSMVCEKKETAVKEALGEDQGENPEGDKEE